MGNARRPPLRRWAWAIGAATAVVAGTLGQATADAAPAISVSRDGLTRAAAAVYTPGQKVLRPGSHGPAVRKLQQRLAELHYFPGPVNGSFGRATLAAVWAFKEVQGLSTKVNANQVGSAMQRRLANPRAPQALVPGGGRTRIEVNLPKEYLVLYRHGKVALISHVSAGGGYYYPCSSGTCRAITPDGDYRALSFMKGWLHGRLGPLYNPVFFIGTTFAIHGDVPVPLRPASHGCVRIPMDIARFFNTLIRISPSDGTRIYIRGRAPGT